MILSEVPKPLRRIKSYVVRPGRVTPGQKRACAELFALYGIQATVLLHLDTLFSQALPVKLEIGFGMGQALIHYAKTQPEFNFIGIEVHPPGIGAALNLLAVHQLKNVRVLQGDAVLALKQYGQKESLSGINIFFPDPWPKRRHQKRRLIQAEFISLLAEKLKPGAILHLATDWQDYAEHMLRVLTASPDFANTAVTYSERAARPLTKFEHKGLARGHQVFDLRFMRRDTLE